MNLFLDFFHAISSTSSSAILLAPFLSLKMRLFIFILLHIGLIFIQSTSCASGVPKKALSSSVKPASTVSPKPTKASFFHISPETRAKLKSRLDKVRQTIHPKNILRLIKENPKKAAALVLAISVAMAIWNSVLATTSAKIMQSQMDQNDPYKKNIVKAASVQGAVDGALTPLLFVGLGPVKTTLANEAGASVLGVSDETRKSLIVPSLATGAVDNVIGLTPATFFAGPVATGVHSSMLKIDPGQAVKSSAIAAIDPNGAQLYNIMLADKKAASELKASALETNSKKESNHRLFPRIPYLQ